MYTAVDTVLSHPGSPLGPTHPLPQPRRRGWGQQAAQALLGKSAPSLKLMLPPWGQEGCQEKESPFSGFLKDQQSRFIQ